MDPVRTEANKSEKYWSEMRSTINLIVKADRVDDIHIDAIREELRCILDSGVLSYPQTLEEVGLEEGMPYEDRKEIIVSAKFAQAVKDGHVRETMTKKEALLAVHDRKFWKEELDKDGNSVLMPVDPIVADQSFKDQTDINKILKRHSIKDAASHIALFPPEAYHEFQNIDLLEAHAQIGRANAIFGALPSEVRSEFNNDAFAFAAFASDPANNDRLTELLPKLAEPGRYFPNPVQRGGDGAGAATAPSESQTQAAEAATAASETPQEAPSSTT